MSHDAERCLPLVSVVIPTYNRGCLVTRAIANASSQSLRDIEILVVDDGSNDDTHTRVAELSDTRIRYIRHDRNKGLPAARNTGIRSARGRYVAFLDDDDAWHPEKLAKQIATIGDFDALLTAATSNGRVLRYHDKPSVSLTDLRRGSFDPSSLMAKTVVLRDVLFDESLRHGEDWDAFIRIAQRYSIGWLPEPLLYYNDGPHARMTNEKRVLTGPELESRTIMLQKHRTFFGEEWFTHHLAETLLGYISSRQDRWHCLSYAVRRCGVGVVMRVLLYKCIRRVFPGAVAGEGVGVLWRRMSRVLRARQRAVFTALNVR